MTGFGRKKPHAGLAVYLIIAVFVVFLSAAIEPIRSFEFEALGPVLGVHCPSRVTTVDYSAVTPEIDQNAFENTLSPLWPGSLRLFILLGMYNTITAFSKSPAAGKIQTNPINKKNSILLKLRI
jgi:hypothetical protein